ncbi:hypothetical protein D3C87_1625060 [compost metagenome]
MVESAYVYTNESATACRSDLKIRTFRYAYKIRRGIESTLTIFRLSGLRLIMLSGSAVSSSCLVVSCTGLTVRIGSVIPGPVGGRLFFAVLIFMLSTTPLTTPESFFKGALASLLFKGWGIIVLSVSAVMYNESFSCTTVKRALPVTNVVSVGLLC